DSVMILREDKDDPATETRIALPAGAQVVIDTQRLYHAVWHPGNEPRYCLITSYESGPELDAWLTGLHPVALVPSVPVDPDFAQEAYAGAEARRAARAAAIAAKGADPTFGNGTLSAGMEVLSEA
ncbi:MAG: hypothetical protein NTV96_10090, partial [Actinobacteria bacterium]|nr:hypothetical protein [Actinomycetota bacterium]